MYFLTFFYIFILKVDDSKKYEAVCRIAPATIGPSNINEKYGYFITYILTDILPEHSDWRLRWNVANDKAALIYKFLHVGIFGIAFGSLIG